MNKMSACGAGHIFRRAKMGSSQQEIFLNREKIHNTGRQRKYLFYLKTQ